MITHTAVAGAAVQMRKLSVIRRPVAPPASVDVSVKPAVLPQTTEFLVNKDDAWRSVSSLTPEFADAEISDAKLSQREVGGGIEWKVESPIKPRTSRPVSPAIRSTSG